MAAVRNAAIIILILAVCLPGGQESLTITGRIIVPGPVREKPYTFKGSLIITREKIEISCKAKIFRRLNTFTEPRKYKLIIDTTEVDEIKVQNERLYIFPTMTLFQRYRSIFRPVYNSRIAFSTDLVTVEYHVLIFHLDNPKAAAEGTGIIDAINDQAKQLRKKYGQRGTGKWVDL